MVTCELDQEVSGDLMGWRLPAWQALLFHRVLPSCGGLVVYLTVMCFDLALVYEHFKNGDKGFAILSLMLMIIPAFLSLIFTLSSPPPGLQTDEDTIHVKVEKKDVYWVFLQIFSFLTFPVAAIGRYCHQIFWWVESVFAAHADDDERAEDAVQRARQPSPMELYLFLQAFLHAAPHAIINILEMMANIDTPVFEKVSLQFISVVASSLRMASTATIYRRFEREKVCGRRYPWSTAQPILDNMANEIIEEEKRKSWAYDENPSHSQHQEEEDEIPDYQDPEEYTTWTKYSKLIIDSDAESDYLPPISPDDNEGKNSVPNSDDEYVRPISIIDRVAPRRRNTQHTIDSSDGPTQTVNSDDEYVKPIPVIDRFSPRRKDTQYNIETVDVPPPPAMPAPTPGIIGIWAEKFIENAESIPTWLSAPPRRKYCDEVIQDEPDIPTRVPRAYMRGLEPQDASAALVHYLGWYMFFVARLISIAAFINLYPVVATIILFCHYQVMLLLLIVSPASTIRRGFYIFLAFIYLFCLMEFKIRFRHVRVWHVFWTVASTLEIVIFTTLWATIDNDLTAWWRHYAMLIVFGSTLLSYMCLLVYFAILKPRETIIYIDKRSKYYGLK